MNISVVICCYNSVSRLPQTLKHLSLQEFNIGLLWEIVIVDNNSTDNIGEIATQIWKDLNSQVSLRVVHEDSPGLSNARKKGVFVAEGEIIVFCDDDNWLDKHYVFNAYEIMKFNPTIGVLGGQCRAVADFEIPTWFYSYYQNYACGVLSLDSGDITNKKWIWGAGMVLRREVIINIYSHFKHTTTGRKGKEFSSGEDTELCYWHILCGFKLWYSDSLKLSHYMTESRLDIENAKKQFDAMRKSSIQLDDLHNLIEMYLKFKNGCFGIEIWTINILKLNIKQVIREIRAFLLFKGILRNDLLSSAKKINLIYKDSLLQPLNKINI
jgi:glycosyltransferase involved in cell wall biosynthesis